MSKQPSNDAYQLVALELKVATLIGHALVALEEAVGLTAKFLEERASSGGVIRQHLVLGTDELAHGFAGLASALDRLAVGEVHNVGRYHRHSLHAQNRVVDSSDVVFARRRLVAVKNDHSVCRSIHLVTDGLIGTQVRWRLHESGRAGRYARHQRARRNARVRQSTAHEGCTCVLHLVQSSGVVVGLYSTR